MAFRKRASGGDKSSESMQSGVDLSPISEKDGLLVHTHGASSIDAKQTKLPPSSERLRGLLRLIHNQVHSTSNAATPNDDKMPCFDFEEDALLHTHGALLKPRRLRKQSNRTKTLKSSSQALSFKELATCHRFVCFFFVQGNQGHHYSKHTLKLRKLLAKEYHDSMTTFMVMVGDTIPIAVNQKERNAAKSPTVDMQKPLNTEISSAEHGTDEESMNATVNNVTSGHLFCQGTGFALFPKQHIAILLSMLNVSQLPSVVVIDATSGRAVSPDALLAIERNNPHYVINSWQQGKSGLSCLQKAMSVVSCESSCTIQ